MTFVELFGNSKSAKLLDFLIDHVGSYYSWQEITKNVIQIKQNRATMDKLIEVGLIKPVSVVGKTRYMINDKHVLVRSVIHVDFEWAKKVAEREARK